MRRIAAAEATAAAAGPTTSTTPGEPLELLPPRIGRLEMALDAPQQGRKRPRMRSAEAKLSIFLWLA
jgi:hypothetical protein